ncbi:hypothetical protein Y032_0082g1583 [Ancylostoma ceylanicum]|nr:hypothetical protein Y032_0082g1583 [Ancylostoma ceylanicum]
MAEFREPCMRLEPESTAKITDPPQKIRKFAISVNGSGGRDVNLQNLPHDVEKILKDFGKDAIGLGHEELRRCSSYQSLGADENERAANLTNLTEQKMDCASHIFHLLQKALSEGRTDTMKSREVGRPAT